MGLIRIDYRRVGIAMFSRCLYRVLASLGHALTNSWHTAEVVLLEKSGKKEVGFKYNHFSTKPNPLQWTPKHAFTWL